MADGRNNGDATVFVQKIEATERQVADYRGYLKKLKARLSRTKKALARKAGVTSQVAALVTDLQGMAAAPRIPALSELIDSLEAQLRTLHRGFQESFPSELRHECESAGLEFKALADGFGIGPFLVTADFQKETASFQFAKVSVLKDVPLNVSAIIKQANSLKAILLDPPLDLLKFRSELHEAMRVAAARRDSAQPRTELRAELPAVFREMEFMRQGSRGAPGKRSAGGEYSLSRFVVELKQFIPSDQNLHSELQFRLEPAVIENTKNPKKAIFIPRDSSCGFGEGSYYQAIVSHQQS